MTGTTSHAGRRLGAGLVVLACAVGVALWQGGGQRTGSSSADAPARPGAAGAQPGSSIPVIAHVGQQLLDDLSLLRTRPEGLPPTVTGVLREPTYGMNWRLAQRLPVNALGVALWAVPANDAVCIVGQERLDAVTATCARTRHAIRHGVATVLLREPRGPQSRGAAGRRLVAGIAPDRARSMRVLTDGSTATVPVVDGAFLLQDAVADPPDRIAVGAGEPRRQSP